MAREEGPQLPDLLLVLPQQSFLRVLVDPRPVLDALSSVGVAQRAQALLVVVVGRGETGHHECASVSPQGVLQQPGQLGVAVGHILGASVHQGRDDVAQGRQRQVDLGGLAQTLTRGPRLGLTLAPRQVDQVEFASSQVVLASRV